MVFRPAPQANRHVDPAETYHVICCMQKTRLRHTGSCLVMEKSVIRRHDRGALSFSAALLSSPEDIGLADIHDH